ncbi:MAG: hypothetical protein ABI557_11765, partial [Aureliella sp.]
MKQIVIYLLFIALSFIVGCSIPAFYDWSGADQSRSPPVLAYTALGMLACGISLCLALPWLPLSDQPTLNNWAKRLRFNLRGLLIVTSAVALFIAAAMRFPLAISGTLYLVTIFFVVKFATDDAAIRWQTAAVLTTHYLPFSWIATGNFGLNISFALLASSLGLPFLIPTLLVSS